MHGTTFKLALSNWETWLVFTSESVTWKLVSEHEVEVSERFRGSFPANMGKVTLVSAAGRAPRRGEGYDGRGSCTERTLFFQYPRWVPDLFAITVVGCFYSEQEQARHRLLRERRVCDRWHLFPPAYGTGLG